MTTIYDENIVKTGDWYNILDRQDIDNRVNVSYYLYLVDEYKNDNTPEKQLVFVCLDECIDYVDKINLFQRAIKIKRIKEKINSNGGCRD